MYLCFVCVWRNFDCSKFVWFSFLSVDFVLEWVGIWFNWHISCFGSRLHCIHSSHIVWSYLQDTMSFKCCKFLWYFVQYLLYYFHYHHKAEYETGQWVLVITMRCVAVKLAFLFRSKENNKTHEIQQENKKETPQ